jgi:hypothetical protein
MARLLNVTLAKELLLSGVTSAAPAILLSLEACFSMSRSNNWVLPGPDAPRPLDSPFVPHSLLSSQGSPVPLLKFQMAPRLRLLTYPGWKHV